MERIRGVGSVRCGIDERIDDLELLDGRARPPVGHDERQRILMLRAHVDEVDIHPVNLGDEVRQGREALLELAPVVIRGPIAGQCLNRLKLHTLRGIRLPVGPARRRDPSTEVCQLVLRNADVERANLDAAFYGAGHDDLRDWWAGLNDNDAKWADCARSRRWSRSFNACPRQPEPVYESAASVSTSFLRIYSQYCCPRRMNKQRNQTLRIDSPFGIKQQRDTDEASDHRSAQE